MYFFYIFTAKDPKKIKRERISVHGFYRIGKVIGDGNFAVVRECKNRYVFLFTAKLNRSEASLHVDIYYFLSQWKKVTCERK